MFYDKIITCTPQPYKLLHKYILLRDSPHSPDTIFLSIDIHPHFPHTIFLSADIYPQMAYRDIYAYCILSR